MSAAPPASLPSGMVTFAFTDIEGSTRILKRLPGTAEELFETHDGIIRAAVADHGGHVVNTEGDAFFVAFDDADAALSACVAAQQGLQQQSWPEDGEIRVRMGVHTGLAAPRRGDYVSLAVHQAARVVGVAHGGQIVLSDATLQHVTGDPPGPVTPLGRYRVRDFDEPPLLHRLDTPGTPLVERPVSAMPASGHNLVRSPTSFCGRSRELAEIPALIAPGRIVVLAGPGGIGKTRLATEIGLASADAWPDGVWRVELADLTDSSLVPAAIADAIGVRAPSGSNGWAEVLGWAETHRPLLIVDGLEHHPAMCADLLSQLIRTPGPAVLATSRESLKVDGEVVFRLGPLDVGESGADRNANPAAQLFVDRARAVRPDLDLDTPAVDELCARLDGLPLAIEIAASRVGVLSVEEISEGLTNRFGLLRSSQRSLPERQRTMRDVLAWSHDHLTDAEQVAFRHLAVFGGAFTVDDAVLALAGEQLCDDEIPELVWALVDRSLLIADLAAGGTRYRMLDSVRDFATEALVEHGDGRATTLRWADALLDRVAPWLNADRGWISAVGADLPNIRAIIHRLADIDQERAQALACTLARYHDSVHTFETGIAETTVAAHRLTEPTAVRIALLTMLADLHLRRNDVAAARHLLDEAAALGDEASVPPWSDAALTRTQGEVLMRTGRFEEAITLARTARVPGLSPHGAARMFNLEGIAAYSTGRADDAVEAFRRELEIYEELAFDSKIASAHGNVAEALAHAGEITAAAQHQEACLMTALSIGQPMMLAFSCLFAARLADPHSDRRLALRLIGAAQVELEMAGHHLYDEDQRALDAHLAEAEVQLGAAVVYAELEAGRNLQLVDAAHTAGELLRSVARSHDTTDINS